MRIFYQQIGFIVILRVLAIQIIDEYFHKVICEPLVSISVVSCRDNMGLVLATYFYKQVRSTWVGSNPIC